MFGPEYFAGKDAAKAGHSRPSDPAAAAGWDEGQRETREFWDNIHKTRRDDASVPYVDSGKVLFPRLRKYLAITLGVLGFLIGATWGFIDKGALSALVTGAIFGLGGLLIGRFWILALLVGAFVLVHLYF